MTTAPHAATLEATATEARRFLAAARPPRVLTLREFAEQRLRIPNGPHAGERFKIETQPYTGLLFDLIDSGHWQEFAAVGPMQSGKTLAAFCAPTLYHLFEFAEDTIVGLPTAEMAGDKWTKDLRPVIAASDYAHLLPTRGPGSRDAAKLDSITFRNGATLKFMSGGGSDKKRAGFTARALCVTESDGLDTAGANSRESDKITQMQGRQRAFARTQRRTYEECTASTSAGRIWQRYNAGTRSTIYTPCPHCGHFVSLERQDLLGWENAPDEIAAAERARWTCSACRRPWTEEERRAANLDAVVIHRGQQIDPPTGKITGQPLRTALLGFRWSAVNNLFLTAGDVALELYRQAQHDAESDEHENAEKAVRQAIFALPYDPPEIEGETLTAHALTHRRRRLPRGQCPANAVGLAVGIDLGKYTGHLTACAFTDDGRGVVVDYHVFDVPSNGPRREASDGLPIPQAIAAALQAEAELLEAGYPTADGRALLPDRVLIDAGFEPDAVHAACLHLEGNRHTREARYVPAIGRGTGQHDQRRYSHPSRRGNTVRQIGQQWYLSRDQARRTYFLTIDSDHWKTRVHEALAAPLGPGALELFEAPAREHLTFAKHLTNEEEAREYVPGRGIVRRWIVKTRRPNHYFDSTYLALAAGDFAGLALTDPAGLDLADREPTLAGDQAAAEWIAARQRHRRGTRHA